MNIIGALTAAVVRCLGYKPTRHGKALLFRLGHNWGGICLGVFIFVSETLAPNRYNHEYGHSIQNCMYGLLFPLIVALPSVVRCGVRKITNPKTDYDSVWFEHQATVLGSNAH